jgi:hypothetical protein
MWRTRPVWPGCQRGPKRLIGPGWPKRAAWSTIRRRKRPPDQSLFATQGAEDSTEAFKAFGGTVLYGIDATALHTCDALYPRMGKVSLLRDRTQACNPSRDPSRDPSPSPEPTPEPAPEPAPEPWP